MNPPYSYTEPNPAINDGEFAIFNMNEICRIDSVWVDGWVSVSQYQPQSNSFELVINQVWHYDIERSYPTLQELMIELL